MDLYEEWAEFPPEVRERLLVREVEKLWAENDRRDRQWSKVIAVLGGMAASTVGATLTALALAGVGK